jgi:hypothetical protein
MKFKLVDISKEILLLMTLLMLAVLANWPVIKADMMYPEQGIFYSINQLIHSLNDLIHVYTHPQMLDYMAPFFRPSGNFLMYQLLTPWLGWHNTRALLIVNMVFLGLTGYVISKLYKRFFPGFMVGGFIAFGFYAMNPGLMISKISIMHFEFAYVFFVLTSLYFFVVFCQKNLQQRQQTLSRFKFQYFGYLLASILLYIVAFTFKESAIMLGPVAACYFLCALYQPEQKFKNIINKETIYIVSLWAIVALLLVVYLTMSWTDSIHPLLAASTPGKTILTVKEFSRFMFSLTSDNFIDKHSSYPMLRYTQIPVFTHWCTWILLFFTAVSVVGVFRHKNIEFKKSIVFLILATFLFMLIPLVWAMGFSWHLSLSFLCEGMLLGFGCEYYLGNLINKQVAKVSGIVLALLLVMATYHVDTVNISYISKTISGFTSQLDHNAVFHPPAIKNQLNDNSILVVQDRKNVGDYMLGNSSYPVLAIVKNDNFNFDNFFAWGGQKVFWRVNPVYNGTLFRWAYLLPNLKEEVIPFTNTDMRYVASVLLLDWVRHMNNIFCVTYDDAGNWFDNTELFKKSVLLEQKRRHLSYGQYEALPKTALYAKRASLKVLPYADPQICESLCDNLHGCQGFTYTDVTAGPLTTAKCFFYNTVSTNVKPCAVCTGYIKSAKSKGTHAV